MCINMRAKRGDLPLKVTGSCQLSDVGAGNPTWTLLAERQQLLPAEPSFHHLNLVLLNNFHRYQNSLLIFKNNLKCTNIVSIGSQVL